MATAAGAAVQTATAALAATAAAAGAAANSSTTGGRPASGASVASMDPEAVARRQRLDARIAEYREKMVADGLLPATTAGAGAVPAAAMGSSTTSAALKGGKKPAPVPPVPSVSEDATAAGAGEDAAAVIGKDADGDVVGADGVRKRK